MGAGGHSPQAFPRFRPGLPRAYSGMTFRVVIRLPEKIPHVPKRHEEPGTYRDSAQQVRARQTRKNEINMAMVLRQELQAAATANRRIRWRITMFTMGLGGLLTLFSFFIASKIRCISPTKLYKFLFVAKYCLKTCFF